MSSSLKLANMVDDKVWTRCVMADVGMAHPETLAFMYKSARLLESSSNKIRIVHLDRNTGQGNLLKEEVKRFTEQLYFEGVKKVMFKSFSVVSLKEALY